MKNRIISYINKASVVSVLLALSFSSHAITDIFNDYDACEFFLHGTEPTSDVGLALQTGDASMLDEASQVIVTSMAEGLGSRKAKKMQGNNEETIYFFTRGREGSNQGSANLEIMARRDRDGICGGIGSPNSSFDGEEERKMNEEAMLREIDRTTNIETRDIQDRINKRVDAALDNTKAQEALAQLASRTDVRDINRKFATRLDGRKTESES